MRHRFYIPFESDTLALEAKAGPTRLKIDGPEATHILKVLRLSIGDQLIVFNGQGKECQAQISELDKHSVYLDVIDVSEINRESDVEIGLLVAIPKGDRQKFLIEKLTEIGVAHVWPIISERSAVHPTQKTTEKMSRWVIESSKQCGRNRLMKIHQPQRLATLVTSWSEDTLQASPLKLVCHPGSQSIKETISDRTPQPQVLIAIGPEGGFAEAEMGQFDSNNWSRVSFGPRILRVETAAIVAAAAISFAWPDCGK